MAKGVAGNMGETYKDYRRQVMIGLLVLGAFLLTMTALHLLVPDDYRACALMPGFCKEDKSFPKTPFRKLDEGYHGGPKFGLTGGR